MKASRRRNNRRRGVTLLELLAVMLIAGLLAAVGVPAFNAILKGTALRNAATGLTDTLSLARQLAITNRYIYTVEFVSDSADLTAEQRDAGVNEESYRIFFVDREAKDESNPRESDKITVGEWKLLPRFVVFDPNDPPPHEISLTPKRGAFASRQGEGLRYFKIVHTESGTDGREKAMQIMVTALTGTARAKPVAR